MNAVTVLVFAAFAAVALSDPDPCTGCLENMVDIRAELGNDGKGASVDALLAALKHACEKRYPDKLLECYTASISQAPAVEALLDAGKSDKEICVAAGRCA
uniref:Saposin B-type domain-containing protein n=1 Tax=Panagrellus redivivus TaxID=6233 RepID=A0A7E4VZ79_PANRE